MRAGEGGREAVCGFVRCVAVVCGGVRKTERQKERERERERDEKKRERALL